MKEEVEITATQFKIATELMTLMKRGGDRLAAAWKSTKIREQRAKEKQELEETKKGKTKRSYKGKSRPMCLNKKHGSQNSTH